MPAKYIDDLKQQIEKVKRFHQEDLQKGVGGVFLPDALERKYPNAGKELRWQYLFPATRLSVEPRTGVVRRHHIHETSLQKAVKRAGDMAGINKRVHCHVFRHYAELSIRSIPLPPICWRQVMISEPYRSYWDMQMWRQP